MVTAPRENKMIDHPPAIVIGEVLVDRFEDGSEIIGGAPLNVAWNLKGFGIDPLFISAVGDDQTGEKIQAAMSSWQMNMAGLQTNQKPSGFVDVTLVDGEPSYRIVRDVAYDHVASPTATAAAEQYVAQKNAAKEKISARQTGDHDRGVLYHGSLCFAGECTRRTIMDLKRSMSMDVYLDINVREGHFDPAWLPDLMVEVSYLKCNWDEIQLLGGVDSGEQDRGKLIDGAKRLIERYQFKGCWLTAGSDGAHWVGRDGEVVSTANPPLADGAFTDAVGAGDAFASATIFGHLLALPIETSIANAVRHAGQVCTLRGATSNEPSFYKIDR